MIEIVGEPLESPRIFFRPASNVLLTAWNGNSVASKNTERSHGAELSLIQLAILSIDVAVSIPHILKDHSLGVEIRPIERDRRAHHLRELVHIRVVQRQDNLS